MIKSPKKDFSKTNHKLAFLLGVIFSVLSVTVMAVLAMWILKINPQNMFLEVEDFAFESLSIEEGQEQGIDISQINFFSNDHILGYAEAKYVFVVYADYQDIHSNRFYQNLIKFADENSDKVKIVWRHFPLSFHQDAYSASLAAECAGVQSNFWSYSSKLYEQQDNLGTELYSQLAQDLSLDVEQFETCLSYPEISESVQEDISEAILVGISGTPNLIFLDKNKDTFKYIGGYVSLDYLEALIF